MKPMLAFVLLAACGGSVPQTHYYTLPEAAAATAPAAGTETLAIDTFDVTRPYDDERMVYRPDKYQLDFYEYHRWAAPPGSLVADYLVEAFARSGRFRSVGREPEARAQISLAGRVLAIEEVDATPQSWVAHVALRLTATDRASGQVLWTKQLDAREPMPTRSPEGLARAVAVALARIATQAIPEVAALARAPSPRACASAP